MNKKFIFLPLVALLVILIHSFITSCTKTPKEVVVYTTIDQIFSEPILRDFERESGIKVKAVYDTEETKSTGVLNRLIAEAKNPQCDVFWSGDPIRAVVLKQRGLTQPYVSEEAKDIPKWYKDPEHHWTGFSARARVLIYNTSLPEASTLPKSIFDLSNPDLKYNVAIANPLFGTTTFHMAALFYVLGEDKAVDFLNRLKENGILIASSNGDVKKKVAQGEIFCGLTDTDDAFTAKKQGAPVDYLFLDQGNGQIGTLIIPNVVTLMKGAPHPENGKRLIDYLLSRETEAKLAKSCAQMPLHKGVPTPEDVPSLDDIRPMKIDYDKTARLMVEIQGVLKRWVESE